MKKRNFGAIKEVIKRVVYVIGIITACYGFWGSLFPDLTLVQGTYRIAEQSDESFSDLHAETLYTELLEGKYHVTYSSKIWETIKNICGHKNE